MEVEVFVWKKRGYGRMYWSLSMTHGGIWKVLGRTISNLVGEKIYVQYVMWEINLTSLMVILVGHYAMVNK